MSVVRVGFKLGKPASARGAAVRVEPAGVPEVRNVRVETEDRDERLFQTDRVPNGPLTLAEQDQLVEQWMNSLHAMRVVFQRDSEPTEKDIEYLHQHVDFLMALGHCKEESRKFGGNSLEETFIMMSITAITGGIVKFIHSTLTQGSNRMVSYLTYGVAAASVNLFFHLRSSAIESPDKIASIAGFIDGTAMVARNQNLTMVADILNSVSGSMFMSVPSAAGVAPDDVMTVALGNMTYIKEKFTDITQLELGYFAGLNMQVVDLTNQLNERPFSDRTRCESYLLLKKDWYKQCVAMVMGRELMLYYYAARATTIVTYQNYYYVMKGLECMCKIVQAFTIDGLYIPFLVHICFRFINVMFACIRNGYNDRVSVCSLFCCTLICSVVHRIVD